MSKLKKATICVQGMHCPSCDILVKNKFKEVTTIREVKPNHKKQEVEVIYTGILDKNELNAKIKKYGYQVVDTLSNNEPFTKRISDAGMIAIILFIGYYIAQELNILPNFTSAPTLSLTTVFILGLVASTSTCMATSGALFLSTIGKLNNNEGSLKQNLVPAISFNVGRVLSYGVFGFLFGLVGKTLASNLQLGSALSLIVAALMVLIGLDMLKIISFASLFGSSLTKGVFEKLQDRLSKSPKQTAFFLGAITYLLPCGFTQSVQLYVLGLADPVQSALIMMVFALGTIPALLAVGFASSFTKSSFYPMFYKVMGVLIFMIGVSYVGNALSLYGVNFNIFSPSASQAQATDPNVTVENGIQIVKMNVNAQGYQPSSFTIKQGIPVKWIVNGENVFGCQGTLVAPKANIVKPLEVGENIFEFTPKEKGPLAFSCSMGMIRGNFNVI